MFHLLFCRPNTFRCMSVRGNSAGEMSGYRLDCVWSFVLPLKNKMHSKLNLYFNLFWSLMNHFSLFSFSGVPFKSTVLLQPTTHCVVSLTEQPAFIITLDDLELVHFERVQVCMCLFLFCPYLMVYSRCLGKLWFALRTAEIFWNIRSFFLLFWSH